MKTIQYIASPTGARFHQSDKVVRGFLKEAEGKQEDTTSPARNAAWKELSNYTGGFDANVRKVAVDTDVVFNMAFNGEKGDV